MKVCACCADSAERSLSEGLSESHAWRRRILAVLAGKSTTIFHLINVRVDAATSTLITAVRNAATQALLSKLLKNPDFREQLVIFGQEARLGPSVLPFQLEHLTQSHESSFSAAPVPGYTWLSVAFTLRRMIEQTRDDLLCMPLVRCCAHHSSSLLLRPSCQKTCSGCVKSDRN